MTFFDLGLTPDCKIAKQHKYENLKMEDLHTTPNQKKQTHADRTTISRVQKEKNIL